MQDTYIYRGNNLTTGHLSLILSKINDSYLKNKVINILSSFLLMPLTNDYFKMSPYFGVATK